jgi:hypothetical protein
MILEIPAILCCVMCYIIFCLAVVENCYVDFLSLCTLRKSQFLSRNIKIIAIFDTFHCTTGNTPEA